MKVKFGSDYGLLIRDDKLKREIIQKMFSLIDLSKYRYNMLQNIDTLNFLKQEEHYVAPNYKGMNYILFFTFINGKKFSIAIEKKGLSYHFDQINFRRIKMIRLKIFATGKIFSNTIFDGKLILANSNSYFQIKDCYYLMNVSVETMEMNKKINVAIDETLKSHFKPDSTRNFKFKLSKLKTYRDIPEIVEKIASSDIQVMGLEFFPKCSGISIIYLEKKNKTSDVMIENKQTSEKEITDETKSIMDFSYNIIKNLRKTLLDRSYGYNYSLKKELFLKKTKITDVYYIYDKITSKEKVGIAHVPNIKTSHLCDEIKEGELRRFECIYISKFNKWLPINIIN